MLALVTGGGRGIGRGIAIRLAKDGWDVAIVARSAGELEETRQLAGGRMLAIPADAADAGSIDRFVSDIERQLGPIDLLVNNAAIGGPFGRFWEIDPAEWWRCEEINLRGPVLCSRRVLPGMVERRSGRIINIASGAGAIAFENMSAYGISKTALIRLTEHLSIELQPFGVSVFAVRPGVVRTAMVEAARNHIPIIQKYLDEGRDVTPESVAELIAVLASGKADPLSGRMFVVGDDVNALVARKDEVLTQELRLLRTKN